MTITLPEAVEDFLASQAGEVSKSTRLWYGRMLKSFVAFAGELSIDDLTSAKIRAYRAHLIDRELSIHSIHGHQRAVRRLFSWLIKEGIIKHNVAKDIPLVRIPPQPPKALTDEDLDRLIARLPSENVRDRAIILILADTGCRVGGLCSLRIDSVDLHDRSAMVIEKGQRGRRIYFTDKTADTLKLYLSVRPVSDTDALFVTTTGSALTTDGVHQMLQRVGERAGVKGRVNAHSFRHAFARSFLRNGGNLAALGRILGHTPGSLITAKYYAVWDDKELQEFHDRYSPLANLRGTSK